MELHLQRHHWVNTFLGLLHESLGLTAEELFTVSGVVTRLFTSLRIPERGTPRVLPMPLVLEYENSYYGRKLTDILEGRTIEELPVPASRHDIVVPPEVWRASLMDLIETAYPNLAPEERLAADKVFADLLGALGVPNRRARFVPVNVQAAARD